MILRCGLIIIIKVIELRRMRWVEHVDHMQEVKNAYKSLVGNPEGEKRPLERPSCSWEENIKI
jgi:hypothetical protein